MLPTKTSLKHFSRTIGTQTHLSVSFLIGYSCRPVYLRIPYGPSFLSAQLVKSSTSAFTWFKWFATFGTINGVLTPPSLPGPSQTNLTMDTPTLSLATTLDAKSSLYMPCFVSLVSTGYRLHSNPHTLNRCGRGIWSWMERFSFPSVEVSRSDFSFLEGNQSKPKCPWGKELYTALC